MKVVFEHGTKNVRVNLHGDHAGAVLAIRGYERIRGICAYCKLTHAIILGDSQKELRANLYAHYEAVFSGEWKK